MIKNAGTEGRGRGEQEPSPVPSSLVGSKPGAVCGDLSGHSTYRPQGHSRASSDAPVHLHRAWRGRVNEGCSGHIYGFVFCNW